jgi:hypothetical protein
MADAWVRMRHSCRVRQLCMVPAYVVILNVLFGT